MSTRHSDKTRYKAMSAWLATGSVRGAADETGLSYETVKAWAASDDWKAVKANVQDEVEARIASHAVQQIVTIRDLAVNIQYRCLTHIHMKIVEAQENGQEIPYDAVRLAESMARITGAGADQSKSAQAVVIEGALDI